MKLTPGGSDKRGGLIGPRRLLTILIIRRGARWSSGYCITERSIQHMTMRTPHNELFLDVTDEDRAHWRKFYGAEASEEKVEEAARNFNDYILLTFTFYEELCKNPERYALFKRLLQEQEASDFDLRGSSMRSESPRVSPESTS